MLGLQKDITVVNLVIKDVLPNIHRHMDDIGMPLQPLLTGPMLSMFVGVLPATTVARVFDVLFAFGTDVLLLASVAILQLGESQLLHADGPSEFQKVGVVHFCESLWCTGLNTTADTMHDRRLRPSLDSKSMQISL